jgi:hypothetical protein
MGQGSEPGSDNPREVPIRHSMEQVTAVIITLFQQSLIFFLAC